MKPPDVLAPWFCVLWPAWAWWFIRAAARDPAWRKSMSPPGTRVATAFMVVMSVATELCLIAVCVGRYAWGWR